MPKIDLNVENAGILSAIWIVACNDENPIITYRSIRKRLALPSEYPLEELVKSRSELFRLGAPQWRLDEWKDTLRRGGQIPTWFYDYAEKEYPKLIDSITSEGVFRSQFRINREVEKSSVELIEWGLQHIERLRKGFVEERENRWKRLREGLIPSLSILTAIIAVGASSILQYVAINSQENQKAAELEAQERLKKYEVSFNQRSQGYGTLMKAYNDVTEKAIEGNVEGLLKALRLMESGFLELRPFLAKEAQQSYLDKQANFTSFVSDVAKRGSRVELSDEERKRFAEFKIFFADYVYEEAFEKSKYTTGLALYPTR